MKRAGGFTTRPERVAVTGFLVDSPTDDGVARYRRTRRECGWWSAGFATSLGTVCEPVAARVVAVVRADYEKRLARNVDMSGINRRLTYVCGLLHFPEKHLYMSIYVRGARSRFQASGPGRTMIRPCCSGGSSY